ncbi:MAG: Uma2 family endonuclease, partial [Acidobacteria bacterium]
WIVDPDRQTVTVYRSLTDVAVFASDDTLTAGEILPGFSLKVAALFS